MQPKPRVSYTLALPGEGGRHKFGVNALALTANLSGQAAWAGASSLFTGGRDAKVRRWDVSALDGGAPPARRPVRELPCVATYDDHSDWVNALVVAPEHGLLVSASSDNTIKLWSVETAAAGAAPRATLHTHTDYVKALAYAPAAGLVVSASLDKMIHIYKLDTLRHVAASGGLPGGGGGSAGGGGACGSAGAGVGEWSGVEGGAAPIVAAGHKDSVYSVAINAAGTFVVSGSVEPDVRLWDARTGRKQGKLAGHTDVVRALVIDADGRHVISASSDRTIRLWDVGMQRCVRTCRLHADAVWALEAAPGWDVLYSAGRDGAVYATSLRTWSSLLVANEAAPVVRLAVDARGAQLWCATTMSDVRCWAVSGVPAALERGAAHPAAVAESGGEGPMGRAPIAPSDADHVAAIAGPNGHGGAARGAGARAGSAGARRRRASAESAALEAEPLALIAGAPAVQAHAVLTDKVRVLTRDTTQRVVLWDVMRCTVVREFENGRSLDSALAELHVERAVPTWFSVDTRAGDLTICLDERNAFAGLLYASDVGITHNVAEDSTVNMGWNMLTTLFARWVEKHRRVEPRDGRQANGPGGAKAVVPIVPLEAPPNSVTVTISDGGRVSVRATVGELRNVPEHKVPHWVSEALFANRYFTREKAKVPFFVMPDSSRSLPTLIDGSSRLEALRILRVRQVVRYVAQNLSTPLVIDGVDARASDVAWEEHIEVTCNDKVLHPDTDLYSARLLVWRNASEDMRATQRSSQVLAMSTDLNRRQFASSLIAGSVAGTSTDCIFFPIDTLKTRLQAAEGFRKAGGFRHLEKGVVAVVAGSAPAAALFFGAYTLAKTELSGALPGAPDAAVHMAAAIVGEVVESVVRVPTELVKQRMQAGRHASSPAAVRDIVAASGVRGLFRGYASTLARDIPFALIQFPLYESLRQSYAERARRQPTAVEAALAGSAAGAVAAAITTPLDVAKTRIMLSQDHSTGVHVMIRRIWREEGPRRLFAGVAPRVLWISFGGFWFFGSFEMANQLLLREVFKEPRAVGDSSPDLSAPTRWRGRADSSAEGTRMRA